MISARRRRRWLLLAGVLGAGMGLGLWALGMGASHAVLLGWCGAVLLWLGAAGAGMAGLSPAAMAARAAQLDEGRWAILAATLAAALASLAAVMWVIAAAPSPVPTGTVALALASILLSWSFVHVLFAAHYAHEHWHARRGLEFPGCDQPDFAEFLYFACTIGMTCQVSDCTTQTAPMRRLVLVHALVSFLFNAVILAAAVNLAAGLVR